MEPFTLRPFGPAEPGPAPVPLARIGEGPLPAAVELAPEDDPAVLAGRLGGVELIALRFSFAHDGRPHSQARMLRERLGFTGRLRAVGPLFFDLVPHLLAAGFDEAELAQVPADAAQVLERILLPATYAPHGELPSIWALRHGTGEERR